MNDTYPQSAAARSAWIRARRTARTSVSAEEPHGVFVEQERSESGNLVEVVTLLLATRACTWHCLMCDLWKTALPRPTPRGAVPCQIDAGLSRVVGTNTAPGTNRVLKLYNGGSFFDAGAVPPADDDAIASRLAAFDRVIVECHPALIGSRVFAFRDRLRRLRGGAGPSLEVAMGLETVHPEVLDRLNKRMTLDQFSAAAALLQREGVALRSFVLVKPPFLDEDAALPWANRSVEFAFDCGAGVVSLIPVRAGNGAMEALEREGLFAPPRLETLEAAQAYGVGLDRGRVFADLWDLEHLAACSRCFAARRARLEWVNHNQRVVPDVPCLCRSPAAEGRCDRPPFPTAIAGMTGPASGVGGVHSS